jgi:hypothetical protein
VGDYVTALQPSASSWSHVIGYLPSYWSWVVGVFASGFAMGVGVLFYRSVLHWFRGFVN